MCSFHFLPFWLKRWRRSMRRSYLRIADRTWGMPLLNENPHYMIKRHSRETTHGLPCDLATARRMFHSILSIYHRHYKMLRRLLQRSFSSRLLWWGFSVQYGETAMFCTLWQTKQKSGLILNLSDLPWITPGDHAYNRYYGVGPGL